MGRPKKNPPAAPAADASATAVADAPAASTDAKKPDRLSLITPITMSAFEAREDRADFVSVREAARRIHGDGYEPKHDQNVRNAAKKRDEFATAEAVLRVSIEGYEIEPLVYLNLRAIDQYRSAVEAGETGSRVGRLKEGKKRHIIRLSPEDEAAYLAGTLALTVDRYPLEVASTPKAKKAKTDEAAATNGASAEAVPPADDDDEPFASGEAHTIDLTGDDASSGDQTDDNAATTFDA